MFLLVTQGGRDPRCLPSLAGGLRAPSSVLLFLSFATVCRVRAKTNLAAVNSPAVEAATLVPVIPGKADVSAIRCFGLQTFSFDSSSLGFPTTVFALSLT